MSTIRITSCIALVAAGLLAAGRAGSGADPDRSLGSVARAAESPPSPEAIGYGERYGIAPGLAGLILREARAAGVAPGIAFGLIEVESGFDARAVGRHGERGLMQIKPSTARAYDRGVTAEGLARPDVNLRIGLAHLTREVDHFGDWALGLTSYHVGRTRLRRILAAGETPAGRYATRILARCHGACT